MADKQPDDDIYSDEEAARRRDAVIRRMIATPPRPHKPAGSKSKKVGKRATKANRAR